MLTMLSRLSSFCCTAICTTDKGGGYLLSFCVVLATLCFAKPRIGANSFKPLPSQCHHPTKLSICNKNLNQKMKMYKKVFIRRVISPQLFCCCYDGLGWALLQSAVGSCVEITFVITVCTRYLDIFLYLSFANSLLVSLTFCGITPVLHRCFEILKCESGNSRFQPGEGPRRSRGLLCDCKTSNSAKVRSQLQSLLMLQRINILCKN